MPGRGRVGGCEQGPVCVWGSGRGESQVCSLICALPAAPCPPALCLSRPLKLLLTSVTVVGLGPSQHALAAGGCVCGKGEREREGEGERVSEWASHESVWLRACPHCRGGRVAGGCGAWRIAHQHKPRPKPYTVQPGLREGRFA